MNWKLGLFRLWILVAVTGGTMLSWAPEIKREFERRGNVVELNVNCKSVDTDRYAVIEDIATHEPSNLPRPPAGYTRIQPPAKQEQQWPGVPIVDPFAQNSPRCRVREVGHPWEMLGRAVLRGTVRMGVALRQYAAMGASLVIT